MEKFYLEVNNQAAGTYKVSMVKFSGGGVVEELIYCQLKAIDAFENLGYGVNRYKSEFWKTLSNKIRREHFDADRVLVPSCFGSRHAWQDSGRILI